MTKTLITLSTLLAAIGLSTVSSAAPPEDLTGVEEIEWPAVDSLELAWVPFVPVVWQADEDLPVLVEEEFDLAKHMELPVGSVVILPPWMLSFESPEDPRR